MSSLRSMCCLAELKLARWNRANRARIFVLSLDGSAGPIRQLHICADRNDFEVNFNAESRGKSGYNRSKLHVDL